MPRRHLIPMLLVAVLAVGCATDAGDERTATPALGPVDGHDLAPTDLERVGTGDVAPDFSLVSLAGPVVTLSDFRGQKNVVLVFYRGWW